MMRIMTLWFDSRDKSIWCNQFQSLQKINSEFRLPPKKKEEEESLNEEIRKHLSMSLHYNNLLFPFLLLLLLIFNEQESLSFERWQMLNVLRSSKRSIFPHPDKVLGNSSQYNQGEEMEKIKLKKISNS